MTKLRFRYEDREDENSRKILQFLDLDQRPPMWRDVPLDPFAGPTDTVVSDARDRYVRAQYLRKISNQRMTWSERGMVYDNNSDAPMWYIRGPEAIELIKHLQDELSRAG